MNKKNIKEDDDDNINSDFDNTKLPLQTTQEETELTKKDFIFIFFIILFGIILQPLYLFFYLLKAVLEVYRQLGCWVFWFYAQ